MRNVAWIQWGMLLLYGCSTTPPAVREEEPGTAEESPKPGTQKSDDGKFDSTPAPDSGLGVMSFSPESVHSGFDGEHAFKVPIAVYDASDDLVLAAKDPSAATIVSVKLENPVVDGVLDNGKYFMVTPKRAGDIILVAKSKGRTIEATLSVTAYTTAQWAAGKQRYENGGTGTSEPACTQCHAGSAGIDHSPAALASVDDQKVGTVITSGISTSGFPIKESTGKGHRWEVTEEERQALVTYLRGLEPRGFE